MVNREPVIFSVAKKEVTLQKRANCVFIMDFEYNGDLAMKFQILCFSHNFFH
jgi:hypothetical protein